MHSHTTALSFPYRVHTPVPPEPGDDPPKPPDRPHKPIDDPPRPPRPPEPIDDPPPLPGRPPRPQWVLTATGNRLTAAEALGAV